MLQHEVFGGDQLINFKSDRPHHVDYLLKDQAIRHWLLQLKPGPGRRINIYIFHRYLAYVRANSKFTMPSEMIDVALDSKIKELQIHADLLDGYTKSQVVQEGRRGVS